MKFLSLKARLVISFGTVAICLFLVGALSFYSLTQTIKTYSHIVDINYPNTRTLGYVRGAQKDLVIAITNLRAANQSPALLEVAHKAMGAALTDFDKYAKEFESVPFATSAQEQQWKEYRDAFGRVQKLGFVMYELAKAGDAQSLRKFEDIYSNDFSKVRTESLAELEDVADIEVKDAATWSEEAKVTAQRSNITVLFVSGFGVLLAFAVGFLIARSLSSVLSKLAEDLSSGSNQVAGASKQISSSSETLSQSTSEQAASLQETSSAIEELSSMVARNAENAKKSAEVSSQGAASAERGKSVVHQMVQSIQQINESNESIMAEFDNTNRQIGEIIQVINEIGTKTNIINDIVFQTKLLSFNASVEAARAGEHGKGFAVVAEEVGNLAQMSGRAAEEISTMLEDGVRKVESIISSSKTKIVVLVDSAKEKVQNGSAIAQECSQVLAEIVDGVREVSQMASDIASASNEQAQGIAEINRAVAQLDEVTHQNASGAQDAASAAEKLTAQANALREMVDTLKQTVYGAQRSHNEEAEKVDVKQAPQAKAKAKAKDKTKAKVIPFEAKKVKAEPEKIAQNAPAGVTIPKEDDPRFKDL